MVRVMRCKSSEVHRAARPAVVIALLAAALGGGCSADVARIDFPGFGLTDSDGSAAAVPRPTVPMRSGGSSLIDNSADGAASPAPSRDVGVRMAALPEPNPPAAPQPTVPPISASRVSPAVPVADRAAQPALQGGETIEVQSGDTLYGLSRRHKVPVSELMKANGLTGPALKPGQRLVLPAPSAKLKPGYKSRPAVDTPATVAAAPAAKAPARAANWDGSYTIKPGDSLYAIARRYGVTSNELQQVNGIGDPLRVRPGAVLKVPAEGGAASVSVADRAAPAPARVEPVAEPPRAIPSTTQPTIINSERKVAARSDTTSDVAPVEAERPAEPAPQPSKGEKSAAAGTAAATTGRLRWPVKGKIVTAFGPRPDGTHNDGVNLSVPLGTEVHAAESGVVAYAGSELKGYGNLILIRHDNGWVTAYAHNDELLVKRGDRIKRGQVVAKAGKSGQVDQPQLHFELRQGSKPVDPTPFMERM